MKQIFTLFVLAAVAAPFSSFAQCSTGGNGMTTNSSITIDGNMSDWTSILNDPDNNTYDGIPDQDAPISDAGRDFTRFAFSSDQENLYLYFQRAGSVKNSVDLLYYVDVNNNNILELNEPVVVMSWGGSTGNTAVEMYNYIPKKATGDQITPDGKDMPGTLEYRKKLGSLGKGSADGISLEVKVPYSELYKKGSTSAEDQLGINEFFKFHISSLNGDIGSVPNQNSINDNFNGCYYTLSDLQKGALPVHLLSFSGRMEYGKALLNWSVAENETAGSFEVQRSTDGKNFTVAALVFGSSRPGTESYKFSEPVTGSKVVYRLKMYDNNKVPEYTRVLVLGGSENSGTGENMTILNNPFTGKLSFSYTVERASKITIHVYAQSGAVVYTRKSNIQAGTNLFIVEEQYLKQKGYYLVEVTGENGNRTTAKAVKL